MLDGSYKLDNIEGIGHRDLLPLCDYFLWAARRKLRRHVNLKNFGSIADVLTRITNKRKSRC